jgi:hypothetical protein
MAVVQARKGLTCGQSMMTLPSRNSFTFAEYERIFRGALDAGYRVITLREYFDGTFAKGEKILVNRVDVDVKIDRLPRFLEIYERLGIRASIYLRLHAPAYNLLSFGNIAIIRALAKAGNEIGLHTELADAQGHCSIDSVLLLRHEIGLLEAVIGAKIYGTASHGDMTPFNNLHFWTTHRPDEFGLLYEAYDKKLWDNCRYISDSEWVRWKAYENGNLIENDRRTPLEHLADGVPVLHMLTHPESWYDLYIYE